tara:strand:+ start:442 stop:615 length:174 start_codon:yes stop_codon:yes gene_type:complete
MNELEKLREEIILCKCRNSISRIFSNEERYSQMPAKVKLELIFALDTAYALTSKYNA